MDHHNILGEIVSSDAFLADHEICSTRRGLLVAPLLAALSLALSDEAALAGTINPSETQITLPGAIKWDGWIAGSPPRSGEMATLYGGLDKAGPYLVLMKRYPGYMSAPAHLRDRSPQAALAQALTGQAVDHPIGRPSVAAPRWCSRAMAGSSMMGLFSRLEIQIELVRTCGAAIGSVSRSEQVFFTQSLP